MSSKSILFLRYETYLAVIKNSVNSKLFRNCYAKVNGKKKDITRNGALSCAFFVSSILAIFSLIKESHATVNGTVKDMRKNGWHKIKKPKIGSMLIWEEINFGNSKMHKHIGFYIGGNKTISHSDKLKCPAVHHWTFKNKRRIKAIFWNNKLN